MNIKIIASLLIFLSTMACSSDSGRSDIKDTAGITQQSQAYYLTDTLKDPCILLEDMPNAIDYLIAHPKAISKELSDSCTSGILAILNDRILYKNDMQALICLNSICSISDGYVSEYVLEICSRIFKKNFKQIAKFMYERKLQGDSCLQQQIIYDLSIDIQSPEQLKIRVRDLNNRINQEIRDANLTLEEQEYIRSITNKLAPDF